MYPMNVYIKNMTPSQNSNGNNEFNDNVPLSAAFIENDGDDTMEILEMRINLVKNKAHQKHMLTSPLAVNDINAVKYITCQINLPFFLKLLTFDLK